MYELQFRSWFNYRCQLHQVMATGIETLAEAKEKRQASGDLVVDSATGKIVIDDTWLWDWELKDPTCYARQAIEYQRRQK